MGEVGFVVVGEAAVEGVMMRDGVVGVGGGRGCHGLGV